MSRRFAIPWQSWGAFYPGLYGLWVRGSWGDLALGLAFSWSAATALVVTLVWTEWLPAVVTPGALVASVVLGAGGIWLSVKRGDLAPSEILLNHEPDLFPVALTEYLQGNWYQAEAHCQRLLERDARDAEALLLLVGVYRRSGRLAEARQRLELLASLETGAGWQAEILAEQQLLDAAEGIDSTETPAKLAVGTNVTDERDQEMRRAA